MTEEKHTALSTGGGEAGQGYPCVMTNNGKEKTYYNVEFETTKRTYDVDIKALQKCLIEHKEISTEELAKKLNRPKTMVEHWFRKDKCFSIPDADIWFDLKRILGIETDEFDKSITTFENDVSKYDTRNRLYVGETSPTLTSNGKENMYMLPCESETSSDSKFLLYQNKVGGLARCDYKGCGNEYVQDGKVIVQYNDGQHDTN